ncbi:hypothetical protein H0H28_08080, partial [Corynebacterium sanguinis]|nr:hypothetical protein [Corynebacterium sanguinis]
VDNLRIGGKLLTTGSQVATLEVAGKIASLAVDGGVHATGSDAVHLTGKGVNLDGLDITAEDGETIKRISPDEA